MFFLLNLKKKKKKKKKMTVIRCGIDFSRISKWPNNPISVNQYTDW